MLKAERSYKQKREEAEKKKPDTINITEEIGHIEQRLKSSRSSLEKINGGKL